MLPRWPALARILSPAWPRAGGARVPPIIASRRKRSGSGCPCLQLLRYLLRTAGASGRVEQICIRLPLASPLLLAQSSCPSGPLQVQKDDGPARLRTGLSLSGLVVCYWVRHSMMPFQEPVPFLWQFLVEFAQRGAAGLDRGQRADGGAQDLPGGRAHPLTEAGDEAGWLPIRISCQLLVIRVPHS